MKNRIKYIFGVLIALIVFIAVLLWVLSASKVKGFDWFKPYPHMIYIICAGLGLASLLYMFVRKNRLFGYLAIILFIPAVVVAFVEGTIEIWIPFLVLMVAGLLLIFAVFGIRKWDAGDNQKLGYKTYAQRKAEKEAEEKKELENLEKSKQKAKQAAMSKAAAEAAAKAELFDEKNKKK